MIPVVSSEVMAEDSKTSKSDEPYQLKAEHSCKVIDSHMPEVLEKDAITIALAAVDQNKNLKDIAQFVKHEYDKKHPGSGKATEGVYHCVVGKTFASKCHNCLLLMSTIMPQGCSCT